jgi:Predicted phosphohydrolases
MFRNKWFRYVSAFIIVLSLVLYLVDYGKVKITSGPCIQITDGSNIEVIWTTNKKSTGFVEYGPDEKNIARVYSSEKGIIDANTTVHRVVVPVSGQSKIVYRVGSTKINNYFQNNVEYGNTVISKFREYVDNSSKDKVTFYILNDIHEDSNVFKRFLSGNDYDFVVLNGDAVNSVDNDDVIVSKILKPLSLYTNGTKPFYFVRGNHETRGAKLRDLPQYISLPDNRYYYTFKFGPVSAVVLDSGEDKVDSHEEYSGLSDFKAYRENETKWIETLSQNGVLKNGQYEIAFVHIPLNSYETEKSPYFAKDYQQRWVELLNNMKIDAVFSGHTHEPAVIDKDGVKYSFPTFIGGGEYGAEKDYAAVRVEASKDAMKVYYIKYNGEIAGQYEIKAKQ